MATDAGLYSLRKAMVGKMWAWWRLYYATNGGETADKATAYRLWALRQQAREAKYAVLEANNAAREQRVQGSSGERGETCTEQGTS